MKYRIRIPVEVLGQTRKGGVVDTTARDLTLKVEAEGPGLAALAVQIALQEVLDCALDVEASEEVRHG